MKTIKDRQRIARQYKDSASLRCKCCNMPVSLVKFKRITFDISNTGNSSYGKLCDFCFNHPDNSFEYIYNLYTKKGTYPHEDFTEKQLDLIDKSLIIEMESNDILHNKYLQESREYKLDLLLEN